MSICDGHLSTFGKGKLKGTPVSTPRKCGALAEPGEAKCAAHLTASGAARCPECARWRQPHAIVPGGTARVLGPCPGCGYAR